MSLKSHIFAHLHLHTQYSLLDGAIRINDLLNKVKKYKMDSVAITDHGTMFGVLDFYKQGIKQGIKPIIGCECYIAPRKLTDKTYLDKKGTRHLILLAKNREGYKNLCYLTSIAQLKGFYYKPRIDREILAEHSRGLICLSACLNGEIPKLILSGKISEAENTIVNYLKLFGENNFFLEVQNNGIKEQERVNQCLLELSNKLSVPLVATNDCHYLEKADARAHEILLCIQTNKTINDPNRFVFDSDQLYFKSPEEMLKQFNNFPYSLENTVKISDRCNLDLDLKSYHFPQYKVQSGSSVDEILKNKVQIGYEEKLLLLKKRNPNLDLRVYEDRLGHELKIIKTMGFSGYFLIVADFIAYAKKNKIPVGPGRGSAAGSLVSYCLQITDLDPIFHGLIFERFLNPGRLNMPDIDIDFCIHGRERVYNYVVKRYGSDHVGQIITFGSMKAKLVIRDVGRTLGISLKDVDSIAKLIPNTPGITLKESIESELRLKEKIKDKPSFKELISASMALEGLFRHASTHAAGVVISDKPLVEYLPLYRGKNGEIVTQFDMNSVESIGLVKFDFLGLKNLTVMDESLDLIAKQGVKPPNLKLLNLNDSKTYKLLQSGDTIGVFQLESKGMKKLMVELAPENFEELTALVALYRPGPLDSGMANDFVERKHRRKKTTYKIAALKPILEETYGVMIYQEQVMQTAVLLSSYSMESADSLRKAIGKKINSLMSQHRIKFVNGAVKNGYSKSEATEIFELIEKFGGYGFNKSHSTAYALIAYQTAYLKTHYPTEFMAALLTHEMDNTDRIVKFIDDCKMHNIEILPPNINESEKKFTVHDNKIRYALSAIKNVGSSTVNMIIEERNKNGFFKSIFDFCERVDLSKINKRVIESLIYCGALDFANSCRSELINSLSNILEYGHRIQKEKNSSQINLFDLSKNQYAKLNRPRILTVEPWSNSLKLEFEKKSLGFYLTEHPLNEYKDILRKFTNANTISIKNKKNKNLIRICGVVEKVKIIRTKKEELMAFVNLIDVYGKIEIVIFPSVYSKYSDLLVQNEILMFQGNIDIKQDQVKIIASSMSSIKNVENVLEMHLLFIIDSEKTSESDLIKILEIFKKYPGPCKSTIQINLKEKGNIKVPVSEKIRVKYSDGMVREISNLLGSNSIKT